MPKKNLSVIALKFDSKFFFWNQYLFEIEGKD